MIRTVLAVVLAAALVGVATPALDAARTTRSERLTAAELGRVETAAEGLVAEETPAGPGGPGPRRTLEIELPGDSPTTAPVAYVAFGGRPGESVADTGRTDAVAFRVAGGRHHVHRVGVDLRVAGRDEVAGRDRVTVRNGGESPPRGRLAADARPLVLRGGAAYRLVLRLREDDGRPTVVLAARELKSENGTTPAHARPAGATA
ncbi:hypothetical protein NGM10_04025 [Halorussus salilacus]|uniref:DUF7311 family protein n=1 Tax=Halorussus salilacus TaxID=2953750 RepID=UPI00209E68E5|nr:hypothetical protein [Halorussus salilacus]USZ68908.1 hypothetical protein NGM10_04025 [Halorussus salilacus]